MSFPAQNKRKCIKIFFSNACIFDDVQHIVLYEALLKFLIASSYIHTTTL